MEEASQSRQEFQYFQVEAVVELARVRELLKALNLRIQLLACSPLRQTWKSN